MATERVQPRAEQAARAAVEQARELGLPRERALTIAGNGREHLVAEIYDDAASMLEEEAEPAAGNGDSTRPGAASSSTDEVLPAGLNLLEQSIWYANRLRAHGYEIAPARRGYALLELHPPGDAEPFYAHPDDFPLILRGKKPPRRDRRTGVKTDPPPPSRPDTGLDMSGHGRAFNLTDLGNAERLVDEHGDDLRYVPQIGWHTWDDRRWRIDVDGEVHRRANTTARTIAHDALEHLDGDDRKKQFAWAIRSEGHARLEAMVARAQTQADVVLPVGALDADPFALNTRSGTVDLSTGELRPHDRGEHITKLAPVDYQRDALAPTWHRFLDTIFAGDQELITFVQRAVGYSLTGSTDEQVLFLLHGRGENGKSTFVETIQALLGDYAQQAPAEMLMQSSRGRGGATPDLARLPGARLVSAIETGQGRRIDEPLVKQLTGGDRITARRLYREPFEFLPTHKLWLATNHLPEIAGTDHAIWRRIRLIPFAVTIPAEQKDLKLKNKLVAELAGILSWAIDGCLAWLTEGLATPASVAEATQAYRDEMDELGAFIDEACVIGEHVAAKASTLLNYYGYWATANEARPVTPHMLAKALVERGYRKQIRNDGTYYVGIGLPQETPDAN